MDPTTEHKSPCVLIVDDDPDQADSTAMLLQLWGFRAVVAYHGHAALAAAQREPMVAGLIDLALPGMDGHDSARRLRSLPDLAGVTLVCISSYGQEEDRRRSLAAGFDLHLLKPVDPEELQRLRPPLDRAPS
jgi:CheY-like chemotaxis protein